MDFQTLDSLVTRTPQTRGNNSRPAAQVFVPEGHIMLGGGGATSEGIFLTDTRPEGDFSWVAIGKDHQIPANGSASAWVISIPACLNGLWSGGCLRSNHDSTWETFASTGYGMVSVDTPTGWVPAGLGAQANWTTYGRLLTDAFPTNSDGGPGATVFSKDHNFVDGSFTAVYAISLSRDPMGVPWQPPGPAPLTAAVSSAWLQVPPLLRLGVPMPSTLWLRVCVAVTCTYSFACAGIKPGAGPGSGGTGGAAAAAGLAGGGGISGC